MGAPVREQNHSKRQNEHPRSEIMSGVAEKARFYLERSVPQLREWEDKELFSKVPFPPSTPPLVDPPH